MISNQLISNHDFKSLCWFVILISNHLGISDLWFWFEIIFWVILIWIYWFFPPNYFVARKLKLSLDFDSANIKTFRTKCHPFSGLHIISIGLVWQIFHHPVILLSGQHYYRNPNSGLLLLVLRNQVRLNYSIGGTALHQRSIIYSSLADIIFLHSEKCDCTPSLIVASSRVWCVV